MLRALDPDVGDSERIDRIRLLEELKSTAAAAQARETAAFADSQRAEQAAAGVAQKRIGRGIASQVGLARRQSPWAARRYVGWATILLGELPNTFAALQAGHITEWRAMIVARETACLSRRHRAAVDAELAPHLEQWGDRRIEGEARRAAYRLDPDAQMARVRGAESDRRVSVRPAPDAMGRFTTFAPVAQAVAAYATLLRDADTLIATGDSRTRGQIMADLAIERLTGQAKAHEVPVEINLVIPDDVLFRGRAGDARRGGAGAGADEPAWLSGYGPIPAALARELIARPSESTPRWLRRVYSAPGSGELVAMESRRRLFTEAQRRFLRLRDQTCRTPWCDAPVRHADHVVPVARGGSTSLDNGQGLCAACNFAKQAPGWRFHPVAGPTGAAVETITPTGHRYRSRAPVLPGQGRVHSSVEADFARKLSALLRAA
ncbi:MAG TPA: DUF222 domain-containing protein [Jatrophihabitans sp.]|nr:DUF222 domain-containing protein [Jatrophihabitans sp.]